MRFFTLLVLFAAIAFNLHAQTVPTKKMAVYMKETATWCEPCGTWGWQLNSDILSRPVSQPFVTAKMHTSRSSALHSPDALTMNAYMSSASGVPAFYVNMNNETAYSSTGGIFTGTTRTNVWSVIDNFATQDADIATGFTTTISADKTNITINTSTLTFNDVDGDYYLGVYVLEDDVFEIQRGFTSGATHNKVFREAITPVMGEQVTGGMTPAGTQLDLSYGYQVPAEYEADKLQFFVILWKKDGIDYTFETSWSDFQYATTTTGVENRFADNANAYSFVNNNTLNYHFITNEWVGKNLSVTVVNAQGQEVQTLFDGPATADVRSELHTIGLAPGMYMVRTEIDGEVQTQKVML